jgi:hypothetical protein
VTFLDYHLTEPSLVRTVSFGPTRKGPDADTEPGPAAGQDSVALPGQEPAGKFAERTRRHHAMVHELLAEGRTIRAIAPAAGLGTAHCPALRPHRHLAGDG